MTPPLAALRAALDSGSTGGPLAVLNASGYPFSRFDAGVVRWLNDHLLSALHLAAPSGWFDVLAGIVVGPIGAVSAPLLAAAAIILAARRIIRWEVPGAALAAFLVLTVVFGGLSAGPLFQVLSGTMLLGLFFIATDPVTSPLSRNGRWLHGAVVGVLVWLLRFFGTLGDGVIVSIALGAAIVPLIDNATLHHRRMPRREKSS
jgi:electron transport complex protein RnfD